MISGFWERFLLCIAFCVNMAIALCVAAISAKFTAIRHCPDRNSPAYAHILLIPALGGVYELIGGEIGLGTKLDIALLLYLGKQVLITAAAAGSAAEHHAKYKRQCKYLFHQNHLIIFSSFSGMRQ